MCNETTKTDHKLDGVESYVTLKKCSISKYFLYHRLNLIAKAPYSKH